jgi:hypothetical protein
VTAGGSGIHDKAEAQAAVVQAPHQVVMTGVGDHSDADVAGQCPHRVRHVREDHRPGVQVRVCVGELPGR